MKLADGERVFFCGHPSWRSMLWFHVKGLLLAIAAGVAAGLLSAPASGHVSALLVTATVVLVFAAVLGAGVLNRRRITYTVTSRRLTVKTGLLSRAIHETRLERIQNVTARQSLFDRLAGVGTVAFDTAGGPAFLFVGVEDPTQLVRRVDEALHARSPARA